MADRIQTTFGAGLQGFNTIWLDVSSCHQDNHSDHSVGVTALDIDIQNTSTGRWLQPNGTWDTSYVALPATLLTGTTSRTWRFSWSAIVGSFMVRATARDAAGNVDATPATTAFVVR